ncbi:uncharacterized protein B0H18DRAFT_952522 [Fomitopsis serialis]|uniref:uncharacterized protein n=1 Tax=Fomitopsis serialis TaxID=139415 RepID=UPI002007B5E3|nr:uncharacterized protein B0H18DRAFT_952522 [Neoantrodia serialis]KAH9931844.1 hypothetical protein B0H18DRAFT_952522 [Neoantrodia serialis]
MPSQAYTHSQIARILLAMSTGLQLRLRQEAPSVLADGSGCRQGRCLPQVAAIVDDMTSTILGEIFNLVSYRHPPASHLSRSWASSVGWTVVVVSLSDLSLSVRHLRADTPFALRMPTGYKPTGGHSRPDVAKDALAPGFLTSSVAAQFEYWFAYFLITVGAPLADPAPLRVRLEAYGATLSFAATSFIVIYIEITILQHSKIDSAELKSSGGGPGIVTAYNLSVTPVNYYSETPGHIYGNNAERYRVHSAIERKEVVYVWSGLVYLRCQPSPTVATLTNNDKQNVRAQMDLTNNKVILTHAILNPTDVPGDDGFHLEVMAHIRRRIEVDNEVTDIITPTDSTKEFSVQIFQGPSAGASGDTSNEVQETRDDGSSSTAVEANEGGGNQHSDTEADETTAPMDPNNRKHDFALWELLSPAIFSHLTNHPEQFEGANEVYVVRVPYRVAGCITIRFFVRLKDANAGISAYLTTPPLAFVTTHGLRLTVLNGSVNVVLLLVSQYHNDFEHAFAFPLRCRLDPCTDEGHGPSRRESWGRTDHLLAKAIPHKTLSKASAREVSDAAEPADEDLPSSASASKRRRIFGDISQISLVLATKTAATAPPSAPLRRSLRLAEATDNSHLSHRGATLVSELGEVPVLKQVSDLRRDRKVLENETQRTRSALEKRKTAVQQEKEEILKARMKKNAAIEERERAVRERELMCQAQEAQLEARRLGLEKREQEAMDNSIISKKRDEVALAELTERWECALYAIS